jgi:putative PIN family toxin of toxin-antitoxin system
VTGAEQPVVVFDCMIVLQAAVSDRGPAHAAYRLFEEGALSLHVSHDVLAEVADVLTRPKLTRKFPSLTADKVTDLLDQLRREAILVPEVPRAFAYERDRKDERYVNLALAAGARYLVTWDRDLLDLMDEERPEGQAFRSAYPGLRIVSPPTLLYDLSSDGPG